MRLIRHKQFLACLRDWDWTRLRNAVVGMIAEGMIPADPERKLPSVLELKEAHDVHEDSVYVWPTRMRLIGLAAEALYEDVARARPNAVELLMADLRRLCGSMEDDLEATQGGEPGAAWGAFSAHWRQLDRVLGEFEGDEWHERQMDSLAPVGDPGNPFTE